LQREEESKNISMGELKNNRVLESKKFQLLLDFQCSSFENANSQKTTWNTKKKKNTKNIETMFYLSMIMLLIIPSVRNYV